MKHQNIKNYLGTLPEDKNVFCGFKRYLNMSDKHLDLLIKHQNIKNYSGTLPEDMNVFCCFNNFYAQIMTNIYLVKSVIFHGTDISQKMDFNT